MEKEPVKVSLIGKGSDNYYRIKFPNLKVPVNVNEELYRKMLHSKRYSFGNEIMDTLGKHSA